VNKKFTGKDLESVWHDSVGYYFPNKGQISLTNDEQTGSWAIINANRSKNEIKGRVFKLWFNHGVDPVNQTYAYIVKPGVSENEMNKVSPIQIIANTPAMQAVAHTDLQMVQVVFYEAGVLIAAGCTITVDQPCVLLVEAIGSKSPTVFVSDPTQKLTALRISLNSVPVSITLPQGDNKGATTSFQFN
jgi:chondroitin AC lyase